MPPQTNPKEVKQLLGHVGYYRKCAPRFSDIARPLNAFTHKGVEFIWIDICQTSFKLLKQMLLEEPILVYPDPNKNTYYSWMPASMHGHVSLPRNIHTLLMERKLPHITLLHI